MTMSSNQWPRGCGIQPAEGGRAHKSNADIESAITKKDDSLKTNVFCYMLAADSQTDAKDGRRRMGYKNDGYQIAEPRNGVVLAKQMRGIPNDIWCGTYCSCTLWNEGFD
jgi:hypothetical protein